MAAARRSAQVRPCDVRQAEKQVASLPRYGVTEPLPPALPQPPPCPKPPTPMVHRGIMERHFRTLRFIVDDLVNRGGCPRPRVGVLCENSCITANFWHMCGFDVLTCDLIYETADVSGTVPHYRGDALHLLEHAHLDLVCAFPPCTYLTNSQTARLTSDPARWQHMLDGVHFLQSIYHAPDIKFMSIENPKLSPYSRDVLGILPTCVMNLHQQGHSESKTVLIFSRNLPPVKPLCDVPGRWKRIASLSPSPHRSAWRSETLPGIAAALVATYAPSLIRYMQTEVFAGPSGRYTCM